MKKSLFTLAFLVVISLVHAQTKEDQDREKRFQEEAAKGRDTTRVLGWAPMAVLGANLSQASFKDWAAGGDNSMAYGVLVVGRLQHVWENSDWTNIVKLTFGQAKVGDQELRKTDDEIYFESIYVHRVGTLINPYAALSIRTQSALGYEYPENAPRKRISSFWDPAYLTQSAGTSIQISPVVSTRLGIAAREVMTSQFPMYSDDKATTEVEKTRFDGGLESVTNLNWPFAENMLLASRLELFAPFEEFDRVVVRWDNVLSAKVNSLVSVNLTFQLLNDVNISPFTQMKESLAIGLSYNFL
jgi:hypothetical protein